MKSLSRLVIIIFFISAFSVPCVAQKSNNSSGSGYTTGIGLRGGFTSGLSVKHFISGNAALEGIIGNRWGRGLNITGLYELHKGSAFGVENLSWEYGGGAHIGFYKYYKYRHNGFYSYYDEDTYTAIGIVGIIGMEYQIGEIPFTIGLDLMPYLDFTGRDYDSGFIDGSASLRYILK